MRALQIAASGMSAQQMRVEVIAQNLANMNTTGYNARRAEFADLHYQQMARPGTISAADGTVLPTGIQLGLGVRATAVSQMLQQGAPAATGGDLDVAIEGRGYLEVTLPDGRAAFTRDGGLKLTGDGLIVISDGYEVAPGITVPADARSVSISPDGEVTAYFADAVQGQFLGQFTLSSFTNARGLEAIGSNLFLETEASGPPLGGTPGQDGLGMLRQGYLEESSVDAVKEITDLIEAQRGYELNSKVITAADQMFGAMVQLR
ncbi:flagellar basal-body rod protein FlgG [Wenxinia saemankumensis]|uniref:Flagellar basal-body rod protein FlgG n=1 Tax=Wenxinia saemankumensis TaxID=1447782 RepID=A0A1M6G697_9RHOB|nr:flagellar basal-body rod protein FlgG [Wenxinia saemankumensis]SHJ05420.1 flagellar basal-body rod protein FlgG [Wenxinia saemankumensis]